MPPALLLRQPRECHQKDFVRGEDDVKEEERLPNIWRKREIFLREMSVKEIPFEVPL